MAKNENIQSVASEFHGDEEKLINKIAGEGTPNFQPSEEFKARLDTKLQDKIMITQHQRQKQAELDAVPNKLKWRFYLTGYGYAVVSFLVLFLIGFCTNIFTGTLKVPTKYKYLDENEAFGELAYNYEVNKASNFYYDSMDSDDNYTEDIEEDEEVALESVGNTNNSLLKMIGTQAQGKSIAATESFMVAADTSFEEESLGADYLLNDGFTYNQTYRFAYKSKLFPKLNPEYPVYKSSGILMGSNTLNQVLKNLKIGNISFKKFQDLDIMSIEMEQSVENGYNIYFDNRNMKLYFYPNSSWESSEYLGKLPSNKQILKNVEKDLKNLGISLKNYGEGVVDTANFDESMGIINVFYPFIIQGKAVRNVESNQQIGMNIAYDLHLQKIASIVGIDISTYDVSNYPIIDKNIIEYEIEQGGKYYHQGALHENSTVVLFDSMEIVYVEQISQDGEIMYVPAIRSTVSTSVENYVGPSVIYEEII